MAVFIVIVKKNLRAFVFAVGIKCIKLGAHDGYTNTYAYNVHIIIITVIIVYCWLYITYRTSVVYNYSRRVPLELITKQMNMLRSAVYYLIDLSQDSHKLPKPTVYYAGGIAAVLSTDVFTILHYNGPPKSSTDVAVRYRYPRVIWSRYILFTSNLRAFYETV